MIENYFYWVEQEEFALMQLPRQELNALAHFIQRARMCGRLHIFTQTYWA